MDRGGGREESTKSIKALSRWLKALESTSKDLDFDCFCQIKK